eukprot:TRINITY_DN690_c3_g1_i1.p1 TRINITY_DN690_c3_g1~~TRINITY_DN690_c3_g1_i1.p1  ORF type:complete len:102 (+),score=21.34 TRINITY_DN690_c3_g1_i1:41-307(+)
MRPGALLREEEAKNYHASVLTRLILDVVNEMVTHARVAPDWITFQILLKISKSLKVLELQHNILRMAQKSALPRAFVDDMWNFIKGEE